MPAHLSGRDSGAAELSARDRFRDLIGKSRLLQPAHELVAGSFPAPVAHEGVDVRLLKGLGQALGLGIVLRLARVLKSPGSRQTIPEALRDGVAHLVKLRDSVA